MYTKSIFVSALLAATAAATEVVAPAPAVHQTPPAHVAPAAQVHATPPAAAHVPPPPPPPPAKNVAVHTPPEKNVHMAQPPAHQAPPPPPPPQNQVAPPKGAKGMEHNQLVVHLVSVGDNNGSLKYFPDTVHANAGEVVQFQFHPKNHTVTESSFDAPCKVMTTSLSSMTSADQNRLRMHRLQHPNVQVSALASSQSLAQKTPLPSTMF